VGPNRFTDDFDLSHPVTARLVEHPELITVSDESRPRALRLLTTLVAEAERRGYVLSLESQGEAGLWMVVSDRYQKLIMSEEYEPKEWLPTPTELDQGKRYPWQRVQPEIRSVPSGRLVLELPEDYEFRGRKRRWADRKRWRLEDKLSEVLTEIEERSNIAAERRAAQERSRVKRHEKWALAMVEARRLFVEDHRRRALLDQVHAWDESRSILAYCDALDELAEREPDQARRAELAAWSKWARSYAQDRNPLVHEPRMPADPDPTPEDLRPFCGSWSPYGPDDPPGRRS